MLKKIENDAGIALKPHGIVRLVLILFIMIDKSLITCTQCQVLIIVDRNHLYRL